MTKNIINSDEELISIINAASVGIWITDENANILAINDIYERISGIRAKDVIGRNMREYEKEGVISESAVLKALNRKENVMILQNNLLTGKKSLVTARPVFDSENNIKRVVATTIDIAEIDRLQQQLQNSIESFDKFYEVKLRSLLKDMNFIFQSRKMQELVNLVYKISQVDSTILILGESGVGKELITRLIHGLGKRAGQAFLRINCGAIPENLLESELFGYEKGAFTGAHHGKKGLFELANGGDIFLDEIGDLPLNMQVKILRVLQEGEFFKVGGGKPITVDVRIITSTNKDLEKMVHEGKFRKDLFYRLFVIPLTVPPLRERKEDISIFIYHFLEYFNRKYGFNKEISLEAVNLLTQYEWPGNVRELRNSIERLVVTTSGNIILPEHLLYINNLSNNKESNRNKIIISEIIPLAEAINEVEKQLISLALKKYGSSYKAAKILQTSQSGISRRLRKHKLKKFPE